MNVLLSGILKALTPILKWVGLNVLLPWVTTKLNLLFEKIKKYFQHKKTSQENEQRNTEYESNPSDDSFGNSP